MNLERLEEAREWWDENKGFLWQLQPHDTWKHIAQSFDAARQWLRWGPAVEAAEELEDGFCATHRAQGFGPDDDSPPQCWVQWVWGDGRECRIEPVLVVRRRLLAEEER